MANGPARASNPGSARAVPDCLTNPMSDMSEIVVDTGRTPGGYPLCPLCGGLYTYV